ncbi:hypothetical protein [uncultured Novosphingobium sp.]|uniref:hypothetical protein n=1 Tax=uncultured Novosphingobium sp. TaxID=292277 RepID=UPI003748A31F
MEPETADLSDLLEGLIAKPVKDELAAHLEEVEHCFERQRKRFAAQIIEVQDLTTTEAKRLRSKLDEVATGLGQLSAQVAEAVEADRNRATQHSEVLKDQFAAVLNSIATLAGEQQALREELRLAQETAAAQQVAQMEQENSARRRQTRNLALLAPSAGLVGAGAIELLHLFT